MRKMLVVTLSVIIVLTLSGCSKELPQNYFPNTTVDSLEDTMKIVEDYVDILDEYYQETYTTSDNLFTPNENDSYVNIQRNKDAYYRYELINYLLVDHRVYKLNNNFSTASFPLYAVLNFALEECLTLEEGETCKRKSDNKRLTYIAEEDQIVIEYSNEDTYFDWKYKYHFRVVEEKLVMDFDIQAISIEDHLVYKTGYVHFKEDGYEVSSMAVKNFDTREIHHDIKDDTFLRIDKTDADYEVWYYENDELYHIKTTNDYKEAYTENDLSKYVYTKYATNKSKKMVFSYDREKHEYLVNFSEIPGWNYMVNIDETSQYKLYQDDTEIEGFTVLIEYEYAGYVSKIFEGTTTFDSIGITLPFSNSMMISKQEMFLLNFKDTIIENGFNVPGR